MMNESEEAETVELKLTARISHMANVIGGETVLAPHRSLPPHSKRQDSIRQPGSEIDGPSRPKVLSGNCQNVRHFLDGDEVIHTFKSSALLHHE